MGSAERPRAALCSLAMRGSSRTCAALCALASFLSSAVAAAAPARPASIAATKTAAPDDEPPKTDPDPPVEKGDDKDRRPASETLAVGAPNGGDEASVDFGKLNVHPFVLITGGVKADFVLNRGKEERENRVSTYALGRIGVRARYADWLFVESEFMAAGGVGLHGTSAYEGQAALQVRQQLIRISKYGFRAEVGRVIDEASVDFFSAHVAESFIQDTATRDPLLFSGFNLGNGVRGTYELLQGLRVGLAFNAANPVATTASLLVGGQYPPYDRFYTQPYQQVNQSANNFPDDSFHIMLLTPSVLLDTRYLDARVAFQAFDINVNTTSEKDDHIRGYNLRGTLRGKLFNGLLIPFLSSAYTRNDTLVPTDLARRAPDRYQAVNVGGGLDIDIARRFKCSHDCADGVGLQYQQVQFQIGEGLVTTQRYVNIGGTYWLSPNVSASLRYAQWTQEAEQPVTPAQTAAGQTRPDILTAGERSIIAGLRFIMP